MGKEGLLKCGTWPYSIVFGRDETYIRKNFSQNSLYLRNSSDSSEDWSTNICLESHGSEEEQSQVQNGRLDLDETSCSYPEANNCVDVDRRCLSQIEEAGRREDETFFCSKRERETNESVALAWYDANTSERQQLETSSTDSASKLMPPQDQSMLATPGNRSPPGYSLNSSPNSAASVSLNNYGSSNSRYQISSNTPESEATDLQLTNPAMPCSQTLISDCSTSECDVSETNIDDLKNGDSDSKRKMSSSETIYPWMKESRQNQKKKQAISVSSTEENDKAFTGNKRERTAYTNSQLVELEKEFHYSHYLCRPRRIELANTLNLSERQIKIWFQNRRMKFKKEQKQKISLPRNSDISHGIGSIALPSGHQRHYPFPYFHQQHRQIQYPEENETKCKSASYSRMDSKRFPFPIHSAIRKNNSTGRVSNAVQSPTQQLQSFVSSSMQSTAPLHHHQVPNQAVPCSPTPTNNSTISPLHVSSLYGEEQRGIGTPTMGTSPNQKRLHPHLNENCVSNAAAQKERLYDDLPANNVNENGIPHFNKLNFSASVSGSFNSSERSKTNIQRNIYQSGSCADMHNYRHYHPRYCHQNSQVSSFGDYAYNSLTQDGADMSLRHSLSHGSQRGLPAQFLPFAYYGSSSDIDYLSSAVGVNSDKGMPLDYSRSAHPTHGFGEHFTKSSLDKTAPNSFVSPALARLTHL